MSLDDELPFVCAVCGELAAAGKNDVWLCFRHFLEALSMVIAGEVL